MALSKVDYNSLNVTAAASKALLWNSSADGFETGNVAGSMVLLETQTASSSATLSFTSNIDSTYDEYVFKFYDIHPETNAEHFGFQGNAVGGSGYNETITSTSWRTYQTEDNSSQAVGYYTAADQAQGTGFQELIHEAASDDADKSACGTLHLFSPSSTVFVKHFIFTGNHYAPTNGTAYTRQWFIAGYFNTTSAIDEIQFKMSSGDIDAGTFKMYGVT